MPLIKVIKASVIELTKSKKELLDNDYFNYQWWMIFGIKNPVSLVDINTKETKFLGKELKQVKGKYYYLRKKLGNSKNLNLIKKIKDKEKRKVNTILHKLSKKIVNDAYNNKSAIVLGKLKNLKKNKGRYFNRKLSSFSYYRLTSYIEYKAKLKGVPVIKVSEVNTSKTCNVCGIIGKRTKNWFECSNCKYKDNADRNAAFNIGKRGLSYMLRSGVNAFAQSSSIMVDPYQPKLNEQAHTLNNVQVCNL